jgi:putative DNA primase/helicase
VSGVDFYGPEGGELADPVETGVSANGRAPRPEGTGHLTDLGNAERLVADHGADLRYVPGIGWHEWEERRWLRDVDGAVIRRMKQSVRAMYGEAADVEDAKARKRLVDHARRSESKPRIQAGVDLAAIDKAVIADARALDADPFLLNVANGTVHLEIGEIVEHSRDDLITKLAPVEFDHRAAAPRWLDFLERITGGRLELVSFLQRAVGYSLTGSTREQVFFLLYGTGSNGKTTFVETLRALFGDYGLQASADTFLERPGGISNEIARLAGARFVAAVETGEGRRLDETLVKRVTGTDTITARLLYREPFEFVPQFKLWLATNHLPDVRGVDEAIWRRIKLVPFTVTIPKSERDDELGEKLRRELPGILTWAVEGCLQWRADGLGDVEPVAVATASYREEMDVLGAFLAEACVETPTASAKASALYAAYSDWCERTGERRVPQKAFGQRLGERGFRPGRRHGGARWWEGVGLRSESSDG